MFTITIFATVAVALLYGLHYLVRGGRRGDLIDKIPGPSPWPFIGNMGIYMIPFEKIWSMTRHLNKKYYPIYRIWQVTFPIVRILHLDDVEALLSSSNYIEKASFYRVLHPWLGNGLLTTTGVKWHDRRRILTPAFHFDLLQQFIGILVEQSEQAIRTLAQEKMEITCDLLPLLTKYTLGSICQSTIGAAKKMNEESMNEYKSCVHEMGNIILKRLFKPWLYQDWIFSFTKEFQKQVRLLKVLHGFTRKIIGERKQYHEETQRNVSDDSYSFGGGYFQGKRRMAILDLLISASKSNTNLDDDGIREEVDTFILAGHDTTSVALSFALLLLAENKEIQSKARAEVDALLNEKDITELSIQDFHGLTYLERCIKESLRLFPSIPFIGRELNKDLQLKDHLLPKGTVVEVHIYDIHRNPNFWPNPNVFDPDRFSPERSKGRHPFAFIPFSAGPRNCIGQKLAMLMLKVLLANILNKFHLEPIDLASEVQILTDLVLRSGSPVRVKFVRR